MEHISPCNTAISENIKLTTGQLNYINKWILMLRIVILIMEIVFVYNMYFIILYNYIYTQTDLL